MFDLKKLIGIVIFSVAANGAHATLTLPTTDLSWSWESEVRKISEPLEKVKLQSYKKRKLGQTEGDESHYRLICSN